MWFLYQWHYFCTFATLVSLVWITYRVRLTAQGRKLKVENGKRPAEDSVSTEGSRKSCQAEKSGEKKIDDMFDADSVLLSGWQLEAWQCQDCSSRSQVCLLYLQVRIFYITCLIGIKISWQQITLQDCDAGPKDIQAAFWKQTLQIANARGIEGHQDIVTMVFFSCFLLSCHATMRHSFDVMLLRHFVTWHVLDCSAMTVSANNLQ